MPWNKVAIVGVGLLGGSLGLALKRKRLARRIVGYVRRAESIEECKRAGAVHEATTDLGRAVEGADLVVLCTPIAQMRGLMECIASVINPGAIITDVGSVKRQVVKQLEPVAKAAGARFIGSHPMAGSEKTGVAAARADLFLKAVCVVTPTRASDPEAVRQIEELWSAVGSRVLKLPPNKHDLLVSRSSHLPHVLAASLVEMVLDPKNPAEQALLCATGFRDTTRVASGSPEMWRDIVQSNADYLVRALGQISRKLHAVSQLAASGDARRIEEFFVRAKQRRDKWAENGSLASPE